jgi:hypothetical protein
MNQVPKSKKPAQCEHIKTNGLRCGSPALRDRRYCYFHFCAHDLRRRRREKPNAPFMLPLLEDANAIQMAIQQVAEAVLEERIDNKRAGLVLFALQTAACNLKNTDFEPKQLRQPDEASPAIAAIVEHLIKEMNTPPPPADWFAPPAELAKKSPASEKELATASSA